MMVARQLPSLADGMRFAKRPTGVIVGIIVVFVVLTLSSLPTAILMAWGPMSNQALLYSGLYGFALVWLAVWLWVRFKERREFATVGLESGRPAATHLGRGALIGLGMIAVAVIIPSVMGQASIEWTAPSLGWGGLLAIGVALIGFMIQGSAEELATRGFLMQVLARRWGLWAAVIGQAVFFTVMHGANPGMGIVPILNLMLVAFFLAFWSLAEGGLWGVAAFHAVWNWAQGNVFGVAVSGNEVGSSLFSYSASEGSADVLTGGQFGIEGSLVTSLLLLIAMAIAFRAFRRSRAHLTATPAAVEAVAV